MVRRRQRMSGRGRPRGRAYRLRSLDREEGAGVVAASCRSLQSEVQEESKIVITKSSGESDRAKACGPTGAVPFRPRPDWTITLDPGFHRLRRLSDCRGLDPSWRCCTVRSSERADV